MLFSINISQNIKIRYPIINNIKSSTFHFNFFFFLVITTNFKLNYKIILKIKKFVKNRLNTKKKFFYNLS